MALVFLVWNCTRQTPVVNTYHFRNLEIGGGGYVTGVVIHPKNPDLVFLRTDVGGAFRYNKEREEMEQLMNWAAVEHANLYGVYGIALDPEDESHLFLSAGRYPFAQPSEVYESVDGGNSFHALGLQQPMGANRHPEKLGEKLVLNPFNTSELWCATYGAGLWVYNAQTLSWSKSAFADTSNIQTILFDDTREGVVYISTVDDGIYYSENSGGSFIRLPGYSFDNTGLAFNAQEQILFACSRQQGVFRLQLSRDSLQWEKITPFVDLSEYRTVSYSNGVLVTAPAKPMGALLWGFCTSGDNGDSWQVKPARIEQNIAWHQDSFPGSAISDIVFDPQNPKKVYVSDWYSFFVTPDIAADTIVWSNKMARGHEEVVCLNMAALPGNEKEIALYSGHADIAGFAHVKSDTTPHFIFKSSLGYQLNNLTGLAFCESMPNVVYALGTQRHGGEGACLAKSTDYGANWEVLKAYQEDWGWGRIAVSAEDPDRIVLCTQHNGVCYSWNGGITFKTAANAPENLVSGPVFRYNYMLAADKVKGEYFYLYSRSDSAFYRSSNFGAQWEKMGRMPVPDRKFFENQLDTDYWRIESVPGHAGHLFLCLANQGLFFSSDYGMSWEKNEVLDAVPLMGLGAAPENSHYPSIYVLARTKEDREFWYYCSTDRGESFHRINDHQARIGNNPQFIEGDRQTFGKVYIGTNGSGVVVGELK